MTKVLASCCWLLTAISLVASAGAARDIIDTGVDSFGGHENVWWIDDQRILFVGFNPHRKVPAPYLKQRVLYIFDLNTRSAQLYRDLHDYGWVCYSGGYISYMMEREGKRYFREGKLDTKSIENGSSGRRISYPF